MSSLRLFILLAACALPAFAAQPSAAPKGKGSTPVILKPAEKLDLPPGVRVLFAPEDDLEAFLERMINSAKTEILVNQYAISSPKLVTALSQAFAQRKIIISILLDPDPNLRNYQGVLVLANNGIPCRVVRSGAGFNSHLYCLVDRQVVIAGSADWTFAGLRNTSASLFAIAEPSLVNFYYAHFLRQLAVSKDPFPEPAVK
jgi:phosphatidylserine/phosphatidylglycerophosphate/cardiolipin synthase-like enzyme